MLRGQLSQVRDLERAVGRLSAGTGNGRDLVALRMALEQIPPLKATLCGVGQASSLSPNELHEFRETNPDPGSREAGRMPVLRELESQIKEMPALVELISHPLVDTPPPPSQQPAPLSAV